MWFSEQHRNECGHGPAANDAVDSQTAGGVSRQRSGWGRRCLGRSTGMSGALIRRSAGVWLAAAVAVVGWMMEGPATTAAALGVALSFTLAGRALRLTRRGAGLRRRRIDLLSAPIAGISWAAAAGVDLAAPVVRAIQDVRGLHPLGGASAAMALGHAHIAAPWTTVIDLLVGGALVSSMFVARALRRPEGLRGEVAGGARSGARDRGRPW